MISSWLVASLDLAPLQIIDGDRGQAYPKSSDYSSVGHCLFLNAGNVTANGFSFSECQFISEQKDGELRKGKVSRNDVILTTRGTLGNVAFYRDDINFDHVRINSGMVILRTDSENLLPEFLYGYLRSPSFVDQVEQLRSGVAQPQLPIRDLSKIKMPLPPVHVQRKIIDVFSTYDDLIENNRRRMALLEESARLLYREWFVRLRFPGYEHTPVVDGVPQGWERVPTPDAVEINPKIKLSDDDEHWFVEMANLPTDSMVIHGAIMRDGRSGPKFQNGDTLLARITPCLENGKTGFVDFMAPGESGRGSTEFIVLRSKRVSPELVYCLARTYEFRGNAIKSMIGSSGRQRVQESCFEKFMVYVPPPSLLRLFSDFAAPAFEQIKNLASQNKKLRAARDLLLPRLMSGELAV